MAKTERKPLTQSQIIKEIAADLDWTQPEVKAVIEGLTALATKELKGGAKQFTVPGLGVKLSVAKKPATKAREGRNPATGETITIAARPAHKVLKARVLKRFKDKIL